jgi:hypothetical protein
MMPLSAVDLQPLHFRIACDNNYDFISHSYDGHENGRIARTGDALPGRNNPVTNRWDFAAAIRFAEFWSPWPQRVY